MNKMNYFFTPIRKILNKVHLKESNALRGQKNKSCPFLSVFHSYAEKELAA